MTKTVAVGNIIIGGGNSVSIQSMTSTDTRDIDATVSQIERLEAAGCEIVRAAVFDEQCVSAFREIKKRIKLPIVADVHFDYKLAVGALNAGADKVRINPGNIGGKDKVKEVVAAAKANGAAIRVGVNSGSLDQDVERELGKNAAALCESAVRAVDMVEGFGFEDIVVSVKSSDVRTCIKANELFSKRRLYPLHIGLTEAGDYSSSIIKSSAALGALLSQGIGDTIRISITGDPVEEVTAAKSLLQFMGLRAFGVEIISCPTCGRTRIDVLSMVEKVKQATKDIKKPIKIAVMGCVVNGPGEAKNADVGIAGGDGRGALFAKGELVAAFSEDRLVDELLQYITENF